MTFPLFLLQPRPSKPKVPLPVSISHPQGLPSLSQSIPWLDISEPGALRPCSALPQLLDDPHVSPPSLRMARSFLHSSTTPAPLKHFLSGCFRFSGLPPPQTSGRFLRNIGVCGWRRVAYRQYPIPFPGGKIRPAQHDQDCSRRAETQVRTQNMPGVWAGGFHGVQSRGNSAGSSGTPGKILK